MVVHKRPPTLAGGTRRATLPSMTIANFVDVLMRYVHIVSAVVAVGGMACILICLSPAIRVFDESFRDSLMKLVHHRFIRVVWVCIAGLTISGIWKYIQVRHEYDAIVVGGMKLAHMLIGVKMLLAVILFAIVFLRSVDLIQPRNPRTLLMINIHLAAIIILLGSVLQYLRG